MKKKKQPNIREYIKQKRQREGGEDGRLGSDDEKIAVKNGIFAREQADAIDDEDMMMLEEENKEVDQRELVFCEVCGHDFCFLCMKNHYGDSCDDARVEEVVFLLIRLI